MLSRTQTSGEGGAESRGIPRHLGKGKESAEAYSSSEGREKKAQRRAQAAREGRRKSRGVLGQPGKEEVQWRTQAAGNREKDTYACSGSWGMEVDAEAHSGI